MRPQSVYGISLFVLGVLSQSLDEVLGERDDLSAFREMISQYPHFIEELPTTERTVLAPTNDALSEYSDVLDPGARLYQYRDVPTTGDSSQDLYHLLRYHVLQGLHYAEDIPQDGAFFPTMLTSEPFSAIRHGQVVFGMRRDGSSDPDSCSFYSGWNNRSGIATSENATNIPFENGLIHKIDRPLTIPPSIGELTLIHPDGYRYHEFHRSFGAFMNLSDGSDMTYFMPTNDAWLEIYSLIQEALDETSQVGDGMSFIRDLWLYHYINDTSPVYTNRVDHAQWISALRRNVTFEVEEDGDIWVNNARIVEGNWLVSNGVVHVIDQVLNPDDTGAPAPTATGEAEATGTIAFEDVERVTTGVATRLPTGQPEIVEEPPATPTWVEERPFGLAITREESDRTEVDCDEACQNSGDSEEEQELSDGAESMAAGTGGAKMSAVVAGVAFVSLVIL